MQVKTHTSTHQKKEAWSTKNPVQAQLGKLAFHSKKISLALKDKDAFEYIKNEMARNDRFSTLTPREQISFIENAIDTFYAPKRDEFHTQKRSDYFPQTFPDQRTKAQEQRLKKDERLTLERKSAYSAAKNQIFRSARTTINHPEGKKYPHDLAGAKEWIRDSTRLDVYSRHVQNQLDRGEIVEHVAQLLIQKKAFDPDDVELTKLVEKIVNSYVKKKFLEFIELQHKTYKLNDNDYREMNDATDAIPDLSPNSDLTDPQKREIIFQSYKAQIEKPVPQFMDEFALRKYAELMGTQKGNRRDLPQGRSTATARSIEHEKTAASRTPKYKEFASYILSQHRNGLLTHKDYECMFFDLPLELRKKFVLNKDLIVNFYVKDKILNKEKLIGSFASDQYREFLNHGLRTEPVALHSSWTTYGSVQGPEAAASAPLAPAVSNPNFTVTQGSTFRKVSTTGGGDCAFHAIHGGHTTLNIIEERRKLAQYLLKQDKPLDDGDYQGMLSQLPAAVRSSVLSPDADGDLALSTEDKQKVLGLYIAQITKPYEYLDTFSAQKYADMIGVNLAILTSHESPIDLATEIVTYNSDTPIAPKAPERETRYIYLSSEHFSALTPLQ